MTAISVRPPMARGATATPGHTLFGLHFDPLTMDEVLDRCDQAIVTDERLLIGVLNAAKVVNMRHDGVLRNALGQCDLTLADGQSVVWASRLLGRPLPERVAGIDLFESLLARADREHRSVYLLGATQEVLDEVVRRVGDRFPGARIAGARNGYFADEDSPDVVADIRDSDADMLFIGMTSPRKEIFLGLYADSLGVPLLHGVGGAFDILAGVTKRAPQRWQRLGLEWLYRIVQEPRRMWRRYLTTNTAFIVLTARERIHRTHPVVTAPPASSQVVTFPATEVAGATPRVVRLDRTPASGRA